ncbi:DNA mismatch repair protein MutT [Lysinibacillus sp. FJAT-14745]|uniref:NUDIX hydrolase n=1 Tax=Lysinibacillus sp. FJAT-14745 TaxID=1704289 RepID=UPI0006ABA41F|nr:NUDIX domain-containing protein [Lysinibacillus sp. FJAT-14745]KOP78307.1 DNA mismatch repair protein MutT [Lysinibacillus sp. FJAT-14745]
MFIVNVEGAIRKDDKWIIVERSKKEEHAGGLLSLIGGKVDIEGNSPNILEKTLKREIFEEIGVKVKENLKYIHSTSFVTDKGENVVDIIFLCEYESGDFFVKQPEEVENVFLLATEEILNNPQAPLFLKEYIKWAELALF